MNFSTLFASILLFLTATSLLFVVTTANAAKTSFSAVGGSMTITWDDSVATTDTNFNFEISSTSASTYAAVGWSSSGMAGNALACIQSTSGSSPQCTKGDTSNYGWSNAASQDHTVVSSTFGTPSGGYTINVTVPKSSFGISSSGGSQRMIFSVGPWGSGQPNQHSSRSAASVNIYTGAAKEEETTVYWRFAVALACTLIWALLLALIGNLMKERGLAASPIFQVFSGLSCIGCYFAVVFAFREDLLEKNRPQALARAFGGGLVYLFMMVLLPVNKHLNIGTFAGSSFERFLKFHFLCGLNIMIFMIVHFTLMIRDGGLDFATIGDSTKYTNQPLPAFIAFCMVAAMWFTGLIRHVVSYVLFRVVHILYIPVIVLVIIHFNATGYALIPGLLLYVCDKIIQFTNISKLDPKIKDATYIEDSKVISLQIQVQDPDVKVGPAQYCFFSVPDAFHIPHPFTVAAFDPDERVMTFIIREVGSATKAIGDLARQGQLKSNIGYMSAPIGQVAVPLFGEKTTSETVVFASAGSGITPSLNLLNYIAREGKNVPSNENKIKNVKVIWAVREDSFITAVKEMIIADQKNFVPAGVNVEFIVYQTQKKPLAVVSNDEEEMAANKKSGNEEVQTIAPNFTFIVISNGQRPEFGPILSDIDTQCPPETTFSVYSCGPEAFQTSIAEAAGQCKNSLLHEETFEM